MLHEKGIDFRFEGELPGHLKLPMGYSRQINLIFKEALTNAFKHSQATIVSLRLEILENTIKLILDDNGMGIPAEAWENSERGINNMKTRAERLSSELSFRTSSTGTKLELSFTLPSNTVDKSHSSDQ